MKPWRSVLSWVVSPQANLLPVFATEQPWWHFTTEQPQWRVCHRTAMMAFATEQTWWHLPQNNHDGVCLRTAMMASASEKLFLGHWDKCKHLCKALHTHTQVNFPHTKKKFFYKGKYSVKVVSLSDGKQSGEVQAHTPSIVFWRLPPNSARFGDATEGALFISTQLSTNAISTLQKVWVLIRCGSNLVPKHACKHEMHPPRVIKRLVLIQMILVLFELA